MRIAKSAVKRFVHEALGKEGASAAKDLKGSPALERGEEEMPMQQEAATDDTNVNDQAKAKAKKKKKNKAKRADDDVEEAPKHKKSKRT